MKSKVVKIFIRITVALFLLSTGLWFILYFWSPKTEIQDENQVNLWEYIDLEKKDVILPNGEVDVNNPENTNAQVIVTEKENISEMDKVVEVPLEDWSLDNPTVADFSDSLQLSQE